MLSDESYSKKDLNTYLSIKSKIDLEIQKDFENNLLGKITNEEYEAQLSTLKAKNEEIEGYIAFVKSSLATSKVDTKNITKFVKSLKDLVLSYSEEDLSLFKSLIDRIEVRKLERLKFQVKIKYNFKI